MADDPNAAAAEAAAKAAADAAKAASDKAAADAAAVAAEAAKSAQTVPLERLQAVVAQKAETQRANEALTRELKLANDMLAEFKAVGSKAAAGTDPAKTNGAAKAPTQQELQAMVREEAAQLNFNERCNAAAAEGKKAHADFDKVVLGDLTSVSPVLGPQGRPVLPMPLLEAALETGNAHEVLYELGKDISEAARIMALRPVAQAVELAKFASKLAEKATGEQELDEDGKPVLKNVSKAPAPIRAPTKAGGTKPAFTVYDTDNFSTEEWVRQREKQIAESRANSGRR